MVQLSIDYDLQIVFHKENSIPGADREFCKRGVELICPKIKGSPGQASAAGFGTFPTVSDPQCQGATVSDPQCQAATVSDPQCQGAAVSDPPVSGSYSVRHPVSGRCSVRHPVSGTNSVRQLQCQTPSVRQVQCQTPSVRQLQCQTPSVRQLQCQAAAVSGSCSVRPPVSGSKSSTWLLPSVSVVFNTHWCQLRRQGYLWRCFSYFWWRKPLVQAQIKIKIKIKNSCKHLRSQLYSISKDWKCLPQMLLLGPETVGV